jgi:hypothetical protein
MNSVRLGRRAFLSFRQPLDEDEERRNRENAQHRRRHHARDDRRAHDAQTGATLAFGGCHYLGEEC